MKFSLLEEDRKADSPQTVELLMSPFGIAPEALYSIDMDAVLGIGRVLPSPIFVDPMMTFEARFNRKRGITEVWFPALTETMTEQSLN